MLLALDVGNTHIVGGVFNQNQIVLRFRKNTKRQDASDELGLFLRHVLIANQVDPNLVDRVVVSSVVPEVNHSLMSACLKYFNTRPLLLHIDAEIGLKICTERPEELGADLIAAAVAGVNRYPNQNLLIIDFGTANTFSVITDQREFLGVAIAPGLRLAMESLQQGTAKLPSVEIKARHEVFGRTTAEAIQSGLYYQTTGMMREMMMKLRAGIFQGKSFSVVGTGGFSGLFQSSGIFDFLEPDLILYGLKYIFEMNFDKRSP